MKFPGLVPAVFIKRDNRFTAGVRLAGALRSLKRYQWNFKSFHNNLYKLELLSYYLQGYKNKVHSQFCDGGILQ